jgi:predicted TPR repeat methyltransferase
LIFADPRLAAIDDEIDGDRCDLDHYEGIVNELGARSVLDIGCGTGVLGCRPCSARCEGDRSRPCASVARCRSREARGQSDHLAVR